MHKNILPLILLSTFLFFGCEASSDDPSQISEIQEPVTVESKKTFTNEDLGIEFQYPSEWEPKGGVELNTDCFTEGVKGNVVNITLSLPTQGGFFIEGVDKEACTNRGLGAYHYATSPSELASDSYEETIELGGNTFYLGFGRVNPGVHAFHAVLFGDFKVVPSLHFFYNPETLDMQKEYVGTEEEYIKEKEVFMEVLSTLTLGVDSTPSAEGAVQGTVITEVDVEHMMVDGPAIITIETSDESTLEIRVPTFLDCKAKDIADVFQIKVGDRVEVNGSAGINGSIIPCESEEHYLRVLN